MVNLEYIDIDVVEAILAEGNRLEFKWLRELLGEGIKIRGVSGRYLKIDRFLVKLNAP